MARVDSTYPVKENPELTDKFWGFDPILNRNRLFGMPGVINIIDGTQAHVINIDLFGAIGDGITDDTAIWNSVIQNAPTGAIITGMPGKTYKTTASIIGKSDIQIINANFLTNTPENLPSIEFSGTEDNDQVLLVNVAPGSTDITVPDGSLFNIDQWAYISSLADFSVDAKTGELIKIKSISGNTLSLHGSILCNYLVSDTAKITLLNTVKNIILENVTINGEGINGNKEAVRFTLCENIIISNLISNQFQYSHIVFDRCMNSKVLGGFGSKTGTSIGLNYGVAIINACYMVDVDGYTGDSMRHIITIGGSQGVSRFITGRNCKGYNITDAGMDAHGSVHEHTFDGNMIHFSTGGGSMDGIISQGSSPIITNNQLYGPTREGILWQPLQKNSFEGTCSALIDNNIVVNSQNTGPGNGVLVSTEPTGENWKEIDALTISNFQGSGFLNNVQVLSRMAIIRNVDIVNVTCIKPARARSIYVRSVNQPVIGVSILSGHHEVDNLSTNPIIELFGSEGVLVQNWKVTGTSIKRSNTGVGIRLNYTQNGWETANMDVGVSTKILSQNSTGGVFDSRGATNFNHITQTANHAGVFKEVPEHAWDIGGSANIPYGFAYRVNGERTLQKDGTSKDIFLGQVDAIGGETGRVILRARGQNAMFAIDGSNIGFGIAPTGANYHFNGNVRLTVNAGEVASRPILTVSDIGVIQSRTPAQILTDIGAIPEAPNDGNKYVRRNNAWEILP